MDFEKLDIEIGNWTEEIAIAEVGDEGSFDYKGVRIFWQKWGTNPNDWSVIGIMQIGEVSEADLKQIEQKFQDFGFFENPTVQKQFSKIKQNVIPTSTQPNIPNIQQPQTPTIEKLNNFERIENIQNIKNNIPQILPLPFKFKEATSSIPKTKGFDGFKQQMQKIFKLQRKQQAPTDNFENWIINVNLNIFKRWLKTGKLINNINRNNNLVSTTARTKETSKFAKLKRFLKTGKWR